MSNCETRTDLAAKVAEAYDNGLMETVDTEAMLGVVTAVENA